MNNRIAKILSYFHRGQKGMTGLETAIILIAFVTVASVVAYSVLSAGIFAAERGKATVFQGLDTARASLLVKSSVLGLSPNQTKLEQVQFNVALAIPNDTLDSGAVVINYWDDDMHAEGITFTMTLAGGSSERGSADVLEGDEQFTITADLPATSNVTSHEQFTMQVMAPTGAAITIEKTLPGSIEKTMNLQ